MGSIFESVFRPPSFPTDDLAHLLESLEELDQTQLVLSKARIFKMLATVGFQNQTLHRSRSLRRLQEELSVEDGVNEAVRCELFNKANLTPQPSPRMDRARASSFTEVPILSRRRSSDEFGIDKRLRRSVEILAVLPEDRSFEQRPRKHLMVLSDV